MSADAWLLLVHTGLGKRGGEGGETSSINYYIDVGKGICSSRVVVSIMESGFHDSSSTIFPVPVEVLYYESY